MVHQAMAGRSGLAILKQRSLLPWGLPSCITYMLRTALRFGDVPVQRNVNSAQHDALLLEVEPPCLQLRQAFCAAQLTQ